MDKTEVTQIYDLLLYEHVQFKVINYKIGV